MANIAPISSSSVGRVANSGDSTSRLAARTSDTQVRRGPDRAEFSQAAEYLSRLRAMPAVRQDLIDEVRAKIASGQYETPDKIDQSLDELFGDVQQG